MDCTIQKPTDTAYQELSRAYEYFNDALFSGELPPCLITLNRKKNTHGYFSPKRFHANNKAGKAQAENITDEIAMNPETFDRPDIEVLSTLVHEMCHLWQEHFGKPPRGRYHDRHWGKKMESLGLQPSSTGAVGGKTTGDRVSHYILEGGPFDVQCQELLSDGFKITWASRKEGGKTMNKSNRSKYTCPGCDTSVWGKPELLIQCQSCEETFEETI